MVALVSYTQIYKVELKICSCCILVFDLKRKGSKHVVQKCMYRFVSGVSVCHRGHYEGLSRCRLVGSCLLPGENFFT